MKTSSSSPAEMSGYAQSPDESARGGQAMPSQQQYTQAMPTFITPAMWQESVASVYEVGMKRAWEYDDGGGQEKRH
jgi:hypothetical protein